MWPRQTSFKLPSYQYVSEMLWIRIEYVLKLYYQEQFNLIICLESVLKTSLQDVLKVSWRCLEDAFAKRLKDILKISWKRLSNKSWRCLEGLLKTSWRHLENALKMSWRHMTKTNILVLIKTFWRSLEDVFWSWRWKTSSRLLQNVFIKTNVCWDCSLILLMKKEKKKNYLLKGLI